MHDVDRTLREFETESEFEGQELGETEAQQGFLGSILGGLVGEAEAQEQGYLGEDETSLGEAFEQGFLGEAQETGEAFEQGFLGETERGVFDEVQEMELAAELLEVNNEDELEYFLGKLVKSAGRALGGIARGPIGKALGPILKKVAKTALPLAGAALGNLVLPGVGGAIGGKLASAAGGMFGLELEGLSPQDREFEVARRFVRFAGAATQRAMRTPPSVTPRRAVRTAVATAARRHAPGLLQPRASLGRMVRGGSRRGRPYAPGYGAAGYGAAGYGSPGFGAPAAAGAYIAPSVPTPSYASDGYGGPAYDPNYTAGNGYGAVSPGFTRSGRWFRRGRKIVLMGV
jgi:hypothetical protein